MGGSNKEAERRRPTPMLGSRAPDKNKQNGDNGDDVLIITSTS